MREKRYNSIDVCKFVMAILVVSLHTRPLEYCVNPVVQGIYENVAACAVPFFFISSGFLLGVKLKMPYDCEDNFKVVWRYLMKIVKLYIIWTIVYLPLAIYDYVSQSASWGKSILLFVRGFFFVGEHYNSWILWYLLSTIYALILFFVLLKKHFPLHVIVCIGFALILFGFGIDSFVQYESMLPGILFYLRKALRYSIGNGRIFRGMFYIPLGAFLTQKMLPANWGGVFCILGFVCSYFAEGFVRNFSLLCCTIGLFSVIQSFRLQDSRIFPVLRKMSTVIYFVHLWVWTIYYTVFYHEKKYGVDCFFVTVACSVVISAIYLRVISLKPLMLNNTNINKESEGKPGRDSRF